MISEDLDNVSPEQLEDAEQAITEAWGEEVAEKLDRSLDFRMTSSDGGVQSDEPQRVLIYYKVRKEFTALVQEYEDAVAVRKKQPTPYKDEAFTEEIELTDAEYEEEFAILEENFNEDARHVVNAVKEQRGEVIEHLRLANAVVAKLTPAQIKAVAQREDVERIEADKPMALELDRSAVDIRVVEARQQQLVGTGRQVIIAVLDGEVDINHPDLRGRVIHKRNYTEEPWGKPSKHGTHVAGIIAGSGEQYRGMAPEAIIWNYKIYPSEETSSNEGSRSADAIEDAVKDGAQVINCSWGVSGTDLDGKSVWAIAAERATRLDVVVVKSAGNSGPDERTITSPADALGDVIVVGATNRESGGVTDFSSRGPTGDNRSKPDLCAPGERITSAKEEGGYRSLSGTSMAAPHVSGIAALLLERNPKFKPWQVKKMLIDSSRRFDSNEFGPNAQGAGIVDVTKAVNITPQLPSVESTLSARLLRETRTRERVTVLLKNTGPTDVLDTTVTLESISNKIKVVESSKLSGAIRRDGESATDFVLEIALDTPAGDYEFRLRGDFRSRSGETRTAEFKLAFQVGKLTT